MLSLRKVAAIVGVAALPIVGALAAAGPASAAVIGTEWNSATGLTGVGSMDAVAYGDGVFIGINSDGQILRSTDGKSWTEITNDGAEWDSVAFGGGTFSALGNNEFSYSTDGGLTWTTPSALPGSSSDYYYAQTYGGGVFVGGEGDNCLGTMMVSLDAINWSQGADFVDSDCLTGLTYGKGLWVGTGGSDIGYSADPSASGSWEYGNFNAAGAIEYSQVAFNGSEFLTIQSESTVSGYNNLVQISTDGINWTASSVLPSLGTGNFFGLAWDGTAWLAGANWDGNGIYRSTDGLNWTLVNDAPMAWWGFASNGTIDVAGGQESSLTSAVDSTIPAAWSVGDPKLPDTGASADAMALTGVVGGLILAAGAAVVYAARRKNA